MPEDLLPDLALIPAGEFQMGPDAGAEDDRPARRVHLAAFRMAVHPVTHRDYARFVQATGHRPPAIYELPLVVTTGGDEREQAFRATGAPYVWVDGEPPPGRGDHPVTLVTWEDAAAYCRWLSGAAGRDVRLPSEAEWEKAARGGHEGRRYPWGERLEPGRANFAWQTFSGPRGTTRCGSYPANDYGLCDMAGNVWEWVQDWHPPGYYEGPPESRPAAPPADAMRIVRGGSWLAADARMLTCGYRHRVPVDTYSYAIGFRVVVEAAPEAR